MTERHTERTLSNDTPGPEDSNSPVDNSFSRRELLWRASHVGAAMTVIMSGLAITARHKYLEELGEIRKHYGTLENPLYRVLPDLKLATLSTYDELKQQLACDVPSLQHANLSQRLQSISEQVAALEEVFAQRGTILNPHISSAVLPVTFQHPGELYFDIEQQLELLERELVVVHREVAGRISLYNQKANIWTDVEVTADKTSFTKNVQRFGDPYDVADSVICSLTGKRMPKQVRFYVGTPETPFARGEARSDSQSIVVKDHEYTILVLTIAHEMGHLISQQSETSFSQGIPDDPRSENSFLEEAGAFGFELLAASWMMANSPEHAELAKIHAECQIFSRIEEFYSATSSDKPHAPGMAYLDAAWTALGSLPAAVNYLISHDRLAPEMERIISQKASSWRKPGSAVRLEKIYSQYRELRQRWDGFRERAGVP